MLVYIIVLVSAIWVLIDAQNIGVRKGLVTGAGNMGPWGWFFATLFLWIVGFPMYLANRRKFIEAVAKEAELNKQIMPQQQTSENQPVATGVQTTQGFQSLPPTGERPSNAKAIPPSLGVAIFLLPILAFATLQKGYSTLARLFSFGWLMISVLIAAPAVDATINAYHAQQWIDTLAQDKALQDTLVASLSEDDLASLLVSTYVPPELSMLDDDSRTDQLPHFYAALRTQIATMNAEIAAREAEEERQRQLAETRRQKKAQAAAIACAEYCECAVRAAQNSDWCILSYRMVNSGAAPGYAEEAFRDCKSDIRRACRDSPQPGGDCQC